MDMWKYCKKRETEILCNSQREPSCKLHKCACVSFCMCVCVFVCFCLIKKRIYSGPLKTTCVQNSNHSDTTLVVVLSRRYLLYECLQWTNGYFFLQHTIFFPCFSFIFHFLFIYLFFVYIRLFVYPLGEMFVFHLSHVLAGENDADRSSRAAQFNLFKMLTYLRQEDQTYERCDQYDCFAINALSPGVYI